MMLAVRRYVRFGQSRQELVNVLADQFSSEQLNGLISMLSIDLSPPGRREQSLQEALESGRTEA
jgi:hypothetical protein